jgi:hypothetical protein
MVLAAQSRRTMSEPLQDLDGEETSMPTPRTIPALSGQELAALRCEADLTQPRSCTTQGDDDVDVAFSVEEARHLGSPSTG